MRKLVCAMPVARRRFAWGLAALTMMVIGCSTGETQPCAATAEQLDGAQGALSSGANLHGDVVLAGFGAGSQRNGTVAVAFQNLDAQLSCNPFRARSKEVFFAVFGRALGFDCPVGMSLLCWGIVLALVYTVVQWIRSRQQEEVFGDE